jgi:hypothetical protein
MSRSRLSLPPDGEDARLRVGASEPISDVRHENIPELRDLERDDELGNDPLFIGNYIPTIYQIYDKDDDLCLTIVTQIHQIVTMEKWMVIALATTFSL